jgi:hypothetical protein
MTTVTLFFMLFENRHSKASMAIFFVPITAHSLIYTIHISNNPLFIIDIHLRSVGFGFCIKNNILFTQKPGTRLSRAPSHAVSMILIVFVDVDDGLMEVVMIWHAQESSC